MHFERVIKIISGSMFVIFIRQLAELCYHEYIKRLVTGPKGNSEFCLGHPTIIFGEICVRENETVLRISVLRCQTEFLAKASPRRFATGEKKSVTFSEGIFLQLLELKKDTKHFRMRKWFTGKL